MKTDEQWMARALELARAGMGLASPNPCVGAVVVDDAGRVLGEATHTYDGRKHAEVLAIEEAGERARGATLFLNLEPCCHTGRTSPCVDAAIASGLRKVVAAMPDPNPRMSGKGFERLRAAGLEVIVGVGEQEARRLNEGFARWILTGRPLVTLKAAMTLDGKIAPPESSGPTPSCREYITGEASRAQVQELRHASDSILAGVGTVIADDPLLTDRSGRPRRRPLLRVILDSRLRIPLGSRLVESARKDNDVVVFCVDGDPERRSALEKRGVRVVQLGRPEDRSPDLREIAQWLGQEQMTTLLIEGGALVNSAALRCGVVDKLVLYYAPRILGGGATPFAAGTGFLRMSEAPHAECIQVHRCGEDIVIEGYLRDPYAP